MDDETRKALARQQTQIDTLATLLGRVLARLAERNPIEQRAFATLFARCEREQPDVASREVLTLARIIMVTRLEETERRMLDEPPPQP